MFVSQVVHLNALISLVKDNRPITTCNNCLLVLIGSNLSHLWVNGADIAHLSSPEWTTVLYIEIFVAFTHLIAVRIAVFYI